ncbi:cation efflux system protein [Bacteroidia bacterium]|nr:cation efflux system protein [Bacteroidia bacterium]
MNKIFFLFCCVLFFSCSKNEEKTESHDIQYKGDTLLISSQSNILPKIKLLTVESRLHSAEFNTTGTVKAITGHLVEIAPPFDGRISKLYVRLGQKVNSGAPVFDLNSNEFYEASKIYFQTFQNKKMADVNLKRQKDLVQHGVGVQKELEEAETNAELAQKEFESAVAGLKILNINPEELIMGQPLKVVSPIAGEVVQNNIVLGQFVKNDTGPMVIVAELSKVWVVAQIKEKYIAGIRPDDHVFVSTDADTGHEVKGYVYHISELLDEETRSVQVLVECDNKDRKLKPGMFAEVHFINSPQKAVMIPASALLQKGDDTYVFVQAGKGEYVKRKVKTVTVSLSESLITEGLKTGDVIVSEGGIYLMAN